MHSLLARQLKKSFGGAESFPPGLASFIAAVDAAYRRFDEDRLMLERSLELSSRELMTSNAETRAMLQAFPDVFFRLDDDGVILGCSASRVEDLALPLLSLVGRRVQGAFPGEIARRFEVALARVKQTSEPVSVEYPLKVPSGQKNWEARLVRSRDGRIFMVVRDITERTAAQEALRRSEAQFRQVQKMESIGRLAGGIAHDFNNLLTSILGFADIAVLRLGAEHPVVDDIKEITATGKRAANLTRQLLAFSRRQVIEPRVLSLGELVPGVTAMLRRLIGEDIDLVTHFAPGLAPVRVDPGQIEQLIVNLCVNARDAMPKGGTLTIDVANYVMDDEFVAANPGAAPGDYVRLSVRDDGLGMTDDVKAHLFEPFFTTKEVGRGTGLGLATCYGIAKQNGGYIGVSSELGRGTTASVYFPQAHGQILPHREEKSAEEQPRGTETVLVVEDEPAVRSLAVRVLSEHGYRVLSANDGIEGLKAVEKDAAKNIRLVLTDMIMPRSGGKQLADGIERIRPDVRILVTTGYTDDDLQRQGAPGGHLPLLHKPFSPGELLRRVRSVLDG